MSYPEKGAKYAGEDRAQKLCRAEGGPVTPSSDKDVPPLKIEPKQSLADFYKQKARDAMSGKGGGLPFFGMEVKK